MQNTRSSSAYRSYNKELPAWLHDRPRELVQHIIDRNTKAASVIKDCNIDNLGGGLSTINSFSTENSKYLVSFGNEDEGRMPNCQCQDWERSHRLCKHFLAIFQQYPEWNWNSLPSTYKDSPYFNLDPQFVYKEHENQMSENILIPKLTETVKMHDTITTDTKINDEETAKRMRGKLKDLINYTYLCSGPEMKEAEAHLDIALSLMKNCAPTNEGLILEPTKKTQKKITRYVIILSRISRV